MERDSYSKGGSFSHRTFHVYRTTRLLDDLVGDGEAEAGSAARLFGGVKRVKDPVNFLRRNTWTCIGKTQFNETVFVGAGHGEGIGIFMAVGPSTGRSGQPPEGTAMAMGCPTGGRSWWA